MMILYGGAFIDVPDGLVHAIRRDCRYRDGKQLRDVVTFRLSSDQYEILDELRLARDPDLSMSAWCRGVILYWMLFACRFDSGKQSVLSKGFDSKPFQVFFR